MFTFPELDNEVAEDEFATAYMTAKATARHRNNEARIMAAMVLKLRLPSDLEPSIMRTLLPRGSAIATAGIEKGPLLPRLWESVTVNFLCFRFLRFFVGITSLETVTKERLVLFALPTLPRDHSAIG